MVNSALNRPLHLIAAFAAVLAVSGFILQYGFHVIPCHMCWWQRYAHYTILAAALIGIAQPRLTRPMVITIFAAALTGLAIACWQFAAQHHWLPYPPACTSEAAQALSNAADLLAAMNNQPPVPPCDKETFRLLGLSLAAWNIPAMLAVLGLAYSNFRK